MTVVATIQIIWVKVTKMMLGDTGKSGEIVVEETIDPCLVLLNFAAHLKSHLFNSVCRVVESTLIELAASTTEVIGVHGMLKDGTVVEVSAIKRMSLIFALETENNAKCAVEIATLPTLKLEK